jgi:sphingomyelin phosphodiesterase acid-like 3
MHLVFAAILAVTQHWLVASDLHLNPFDRSAAPAAYHTDSNWPLVHAAIAAMKKADPDPDVVVLDGDLLAHQWPTKARAAGKDAARSAEQTFAELAQEFDRAFPNAQFLLTLGNNDDACGDYRSGRDSAYRDALAVAWAPLVNRHGAAPDFVREFVRGGFYRARLPHGRTALVLDDVYWSLFYRPCGKGSIGNDQFAWFERNLQSLPRTQHAVVLLHIPPGIDPVATLVAHRFLIIPYISTGARLHFERDEGDYRDRIGFVLAGHMHRTDIRLSGGVPVLIASSISPIYNNNPSFMRLFFNGQSAPADFQTYAYDPEDGSWSENFDFDSTFGVHSFDAASVLRAHDEIGRDDEIRTTWTQAQVGGSDYWHNIRRTWTAYWCAQTETGDKYISCAGDRRRTSLLFGAAAAAALAVVAVVVLAAVWYSRKRWRQKQSSGA